MGQMYKLMEDNKEIRTVEITIDKKCDYCRKTLARDSLIYGYYNSARKIGHHLLCFSRASKFINCREELVRFRLIK